MNIQERIVSFFYHWHHFECNHHIDIIDFDLIQKQAVFPGAFRSREQALDELEALIWDYRNLTDRSLFIEKKLIACLYYLRALMGEQIGFSEYVEKTMGIKPVMIPESYLRKARERVVGMLESLQYPYTTDGLNRYNEDNLFADAAAIQNAFKRFEEQVIPDVSRWLGLTFRIDYQSEFVEVDAYWLNWVGTRDQGQIFLKYNLHPRKRAMWQRGVEEIMVFHEIGAHVLQALCWKNEIAQGHMEPCLGLTTVFTPEQFICEGIAQTLFHFFLNPPLSDHGRFSAARSNLRQMVLSNAHIMANQEIEDDRIYEYITSFLPDQDKEQVIKNMNERRTHPLFRTYQYIYGIGAYYHELLAARLSPEQKKQYVVDIFNRALLPEQILDTYALS